MVRAAGRQVSLKKTPDAGKAGKTVTQTYEVLASADSTRVVADGEGDQRPQQYTNTSGKTINPPHPSGASPDRAGGDCAS